MNINHATLRNGSEEAVSMVAIVMISLEDLPVGDRVELVMKCRDSSHVIDPHSMTTLLEFSLIRDDGSVSTCIKNIVLSSSVGDGLDMAFVSPVAPR